MAKLNDLFPVQQVKNAFGNVGKSVSNFLAPVAEKASSLYETYKPYLDYNPISQETVKNRWEELKKQDAEISKENKLIAEKGWGGLPKETQDKIIKRDLNAVMGITLSLHPSTTMNISQVEENIAKANEMMKVGTPQPQTPGPFSKPTRSVNQGAWQTMSQNTSGRSLLTEFENAHKLGDKQLMASIAEEIMKVPPSSPLFQYVDTFRSLYKNLGLARYSSLPKLGSIPYALKVQEMTQGINPPWRPVGGIHEGQVTVDAINGVAQNVTPQEMSIPERFLRGVFK